MMKLIERPVAAVIMFTKLPLWKLFPDIPSDAYRHVVTWWPLCGWLTGGLCALLYVSLSLCLPSLPAATLAIGFRIMLSGGYHEDGLADFFDGFGGGRDKEGILAIMKDSHIGTYGVIALILYLITSILLLSSLSPAAGGIMILAADSWGKFCSGRMLSFLKYARTCNKSKNLAAYPKPSTMDIIISLICALIPMAVSVLFIHDIWFQLLLSSLASIIVSLLLMYYMKIKINGYTGDCCGAVYLLSELSFCITFTIMIL